MTTAADTVVDVLGLKQQRKLVAQVRAVVQLAPLVRPSAGGMPMSVMVTNAGSMGWFADEKGYRYQATHPKWETPWPPLPEAWRALADPYDPGAKWVAHIVWYGSEEREGRGAQLGWHRDKTEPDTSGTIVTVSLGDPAVWGVREDEDSTPSSTILETGSVVLLKGPTRHYLHRVAKVMSSASGNLLHPSPLEKPGRIALSIRSGAC